jgi:hypothetical protein
MSSRTDGIRRAALVVAIALAACGFAVAPGGAQNAPGSAAPPPGTAAPAPAPVTSTGSVAGVITDAAQNPVPGVSISVSGPVAKSAVTDAAGSYSIDELPPGVYRINVTKGGFTPEQDNVTVSAGSITTAKVQLAAASFSSIKQIGRVSTQSGTRNAINTSTASVATISGATFIDQGQLNVNRTLNELPGVTIGVGSGFSGGTYGDGVANGASPIVTGVPQLRGALPYETASLIDGHPISIGVYGTFNPAFISPYILQDIEVVKGPGANPTNINYAIGGTVNFRTLEPTRTAKQSFDLGVDQFGGQNANLRATGTVAGGRLGYAFDYATQGTQGFDRGWDPLDPLNLSNGSIINGVPTCAGVANASSCFPSVIKTNTNFAAASNLTAPLVLCCPQTPMESSSRNELGKLRYSFTPATSLTLTYLGGQIRGSALAANLFTFPSYFFGPPAGYTGSLPAGAPTFENDQGDSQLDTNANLYAADFHTAAGPVTLNARYDAAAVDTANLQYGEGPTPGSGSVFGLLYGGVPLGTNVDPTIFNGTPGTVTLLNSYVGVRTQDKLNGFTFEGDLPSGNNVYSISYDSVHTKSSAYTINSNPGGDVVTVPPGSGQTFGTFMVRGQFELRSGLTATLSNYATTYTDHYTQNSGVTFLDSSHAYDAPRLAFAWRPGVNTAVRASTGFSVAPPYIELLTNSSAATPDRTPPTNFTSTGNAGDVRPETAFGFDLGADQRLRGDLTVSADVYQTTLHDQFLSTTSLSTSQFYLPANNPYGGAAGYYPLYITQTENLGHSRYEGVELSVHRDPLVGLGFKLQGSLQRAYAYDLPPGFYNTAAGVDTANLGILPNENFQAGGQGYNTLGPSRVPYSQGYAEINSRAHNGSYLLVGVAYYGPNNQYNQLPFGVVNASFRQPITKRLSLLFAATNITGAYSDFRYNIYGGIPTPLVNGTLGYTAGNVIGPSTASVTLHADL